MSTQKRIMLYGLLMNVFFLSACTNTSGSGEGAVEEGSQQVATSEIPSDEVSEATSENADSADDQAESQQEEKVTLDLEEDLLNPSSIAVLANKQYALGEDYVPDDLVTVEVSTVLENPEIKQLRKVAADALKKMFAAAEEDGEILHARSGYRSYQTQVQLFNNYVSQNGEEAASRFSARPGQSEHQTGLAMDVTSESVNYQLTEDFGETSEGTWVRENAHEYGFIVRYLEGKEDITGYLYEPWHLRYLGEELAAEVYESGLTYEEYLMERGINIETNN